jgi:phosphoribosylformylglycinamidine cyclo-ligase
LFHKLFAKYPDYLTQDEDYCLIMHADRAELKSLFGIHVLERNRRHLSMEGIAQDALIMNIDDLLCVGQQIIFYFHPPSEEIKI